ncbi:unnamed protein product [Schistosoma rodhaini]|nr:unnamed protein product [Schistosoma rodhaini]
MNNSTPKIPQFARKCYEYYKMYIEINKSDYLPSLMVQKSLVNFYIGLCLALLSTLFIGTSFIFKKLALRRSSRNGLSAGDGSLSYLCEWMWWMGFILMGIGEFANFVAYTFAPAILVTPLGALSVLVSALLSVRFLNEHLNCIGGFGCCVCILGSTLIVLHAPKEQNLTSLHEMWSRATDPSFIIYSLFVILLSIVLIFILGPRYGKTNPIIFTLVSGSIGSLSVVTCKGIGVGLKNAFTIGFLPMLTSWFFWFLIIWLIGAITIQMYYLNRALDLFSTGIVTPLLYVFFTGFVIIASTVLFHELNALDYMDYVGLIFGLIFTVLGIVMITVLKDSNFSWKSLRTLSQAKHSIYSSSNSSFDMHNKLYRRIISFKPTLNGSKTQHSRHLSFDQMSTEKLISDHHSDSELTDVVQLLPHITSRNSNKNDHPMSGKARMTRIQSFANSPQSYTATNGIVSVSS